MADSTTPPEKPETVTEGIPTPQPAEGHQRHADTAEAQTAGRGDDGEHTRDARDGTTPSGETSEAGMHADQPASPEATPGIEGHSTTARDARDGTSQGG